MSSSSRFYDYESRATQYITVQERDLYPEYLEDAIGLYEPAFRRFRELAEIAQMSSDLLLLILDESVDMRIQLLRIFRKFVSPDTSVEMLKRKAKVNDVIRDFGKSFRVRDISSLRTVLQQRPILDEALAAILWEHHDRGVRGY